MKWIDFYIIAVVTFILRLLIKDNLLYLLSGIPVGVFLGYLRAKSNYEELKERMKKGDWNE